MRFSLHETLSVDGSVNAGSEQEGPAEVFSAVLHRLTNGAEGHTTYFSNGAPRLPYFLEVIDVALSIAQTGLTSALLIILMAAKELTYKFDDDLMYYGLLFIGVPVAVKVAGVLADFGQRFDAIGDSSLLVDKASDSVARVPYMLFGSGAKTRFVTVQQAVLVTGLTSLFTSAWIAVLLHSVIKAVSRKSSFYLAVTQALLAVLTFGSVPEANRHHKYTLHPQWPSRLSCWRVFLGVFAVPAVATVAALFMQSL